MVKPTEQPEEQKLPTLEQRSQAIAQAIMGNTEGHFVPKGEMAVTINRLHDRPLQHIYYDGFRDGVAYIIEKLLSGRLDLIELEKDEDDGA